MAISRSAVRKEKSYSVTEVIGRIYECTELGMGIVPLFGSGLSAASGIPAGIDYRAYLFYCLARVFGTDGLSDTAQAAWNPRTLRWPDITEVPLYPDVRNAMSLWALRQLQKVRESGKDYHDARWQAAGAVADWRAMLHLLSRLTIQKNPQGEEEVVQTYPDQRIIDSFFVHLTGNRRPNSASLLLAHLADILRIKIILTTNFDNLIESAFQVFSMPVAVYDVHMDAHLPDADFVRAQRSIIKLHGGRYGLRADFSLDKYPTSDDVEKFIAYLSLYDKDYTHIGDNQRNMLVMGVSGNERRTIALICRAMAQLSGLKIFWVCHRNREIPGVSLAFRRTFETLDSRGELINQSVDDCMERIFITHFSSPALFLLQLYQKIFLSLPPAGVQFPAVWRLPPEWKKDEPEIEKESMDRFMDKVAKAARVQWLDESHTTLPTATQYYHKISETYRGVWIDVHHPLDPYDLAFIIIEAVARELGIQNVIPISIKGAPATWSIPAEFGKLLNNLIQQSVRQLVIFVNCSELKKTRDWALVKDCLSRLQSKRVVFVLCGGKARQTHLPKDELCRRVYQFLSDENILLIQHQARRTYNERYTNALGRIEEGPTLSLPRFLLALTLFRQPCYFSVLHTWACIKAPASLSTQHDNDILRYSIAWASVQSLRTLGLLEMDEGQFIYVPDRYRPDIRQIVQSVLHDEDLPSVTAEAHQGIGDWYMKLYRASGDIDAAFESLYHRMACYQLAKNLDKGRNRTRLIKTSLIEAGQVIDVIEEDIQNLCHSFALERLFQEMADTLKDEQDHAPADWPWLSLTLNQLRCRLLHSQVQYERQIGYRHSTKHISLVPAMAGYVVPQVSNILLFEIFKEQEESFRRTVDDILQGKGKTVWTSDPEYRWSESITKERIEQLYELTGLFIHRREYEKAGRLLNAIIAYFSFQIEQPQDRTQATATEEMRANVRKWIETVQAQIRTLFGAAVKSPLMTVEIRDSIALSLTQDIYKLMVILLRRRQSLEYHRAQTMEYTGENIGLIHRLLQDAEITYMYSTEIMRYISDSVFLNRENAYLRTSTGLILSKMNRPHEAYRRYNEAYGYLNFLPRAMQSEYVNIDLNRGETFLHLLKMEGQLEKGLLQNATDGQILTRTQRRQLGYLYDAIASVERAETRLQGTTVNNWIYSRICELQLMLCVETARLRKEIAIPQTRHREFVENDKYDLFGRCRECELCGKRLSKNLEKGLLMVGEDPIRLARYLELSLWFQKSLPACPPRKQSRDVNQAFRESMQTGLESLQEMRKNIRSAEVARYIDGVVQGLRNAGLKTIEL